VDCGGFHGLQQMLATSARRQREPVMDAWGRHLAKVSFFAMAVAFPRYAVADTHSHCLEIWPNLLRL